MKDLIRWWLVHLLTWAALYGAFVAKLDGALYVVKFWVWVAALASLRLLSDQAAKDAAKKPPRPVARFLAVLQSWVVLGLLVWFGHIATALAWGVMMLVFAFHRDATAKVREAKEDAARQAQRMFS